MTGLSSRFWTVAILTATALLLGSCGSDDDGGTTGPPVNSADIPSVPVPEIHGDVDFQSEDATATQAEALVAAQLGMASAMVSMGSVYVSPLDDADWGSSSEDCWSWSYAYQECTWTYEVCLDGDIYEWTMTLDGDCLPGEPVFDNWILMQGAMNEDGTAGSLSWFEYGSTEVASSMTWTSSESSANWNLYNGAVAEENLMATMSWVQNPDGSEDMTWTTQTGKIETHMDAGGQSGWMKSYTGDWSTNEWTLYWEIYWYANGSGGWTTFDPISGEPTTETW